jgi:hypothetical protein
MELRGHKTSRKPTSVQVKLYDYCCSLNDVNRAWKGLGPSDGQTVAMPHCLNTHQPK